MTKAHARRTAVVEVRVEERDRPGYYPDTKVTVIRDCGHEVNWSGPDDKRPQVGSVARCIGCLLDRAEYQVWNDYRAGRSDPVILL